MGRKTQVSFNLRKYVESIATARSECTAKHENNASYNIDYIILDLVDFLGNDFKEIKTQIEKRNIHNCKKSIALIKIGLLLVISDNFLSTIGENNALPICISYGKPKLNSLLSQVFIYKETTSSTENTSSIFVLRWDVFKLIKSTFIKI